MKGVKEWWIICYNQNNMLPQNRGQWAYDKEQMDYHAGYAEESRKEFYDKHVHVIEYAAYEELNSEAKRYKSALETIRDQGATEFSAKLYAAAVLNGLEQPGPIVAGSQAEPKD